MTDGLGSVSYGYDSLSRMTSETRTFNGVGSYSLGYLYNLANELTSITGPSQFGSVWTVVMTRIFITPTRTTRTSGMDSVTMRRGI